MIFKSGKNQWDSTCVANDQQAWLGASDRLNTGIQDHHKITRYCKTKKINMLWNEISGFDSLKKISRPKRKQNKTGTKSYMRIFNRTELMYVG